MLELPGRMTIMDADQNSDKDEQIAKLTSRIDEMEKRILSLETEMSAIGKMEGAIKTIFGGGGGNSKED